MPTHEELPLTREQRANPVFIRGMSGGLMVHMTGMVAFVHSYYVLGLRHAEGWIGYGGRIHSARFKALARPGPPLLLECTATEDAKHPKQVLARYEFRFTQERGGRLRGRPDGTLDEDRRTLITAVCRL